MTVDVFHSVRGIGHVHTVTLYDTASHRIDVDGKRFWISEGVSLGQAAASACAGRLKPVVKPVPQTSIDPGAGADVAPIHGSYLDQEEGEKEDLQSES